MNKSNNEKKNSAAALIQQNWRARRDKKNEESAIWKALNPEPGRSEEYQQFLDDLAMMEYWTKVRA